jgi:hypothetical protein
MLPFPQLKDTRTSQIWSLLGQNQICPSEELEAALEAAAAELAWEAELAADCAEEAAGRRQQVVLSPYGVPVPVFVPPCARHAAFVMTT